MGRSRHWTDETVAAFVRELGERVGRVPTMNDAGPIARSITRATGPWSRAQALAGYEPRQKRGRPAKPREPGPPKPPRVRAPRPVRTPTVIYEVPSEGLSPDERVLVVEAISRVGRINPSPDEVLMRACPEYGRNRKHTARWKRLYAYVRDAVGYGQGTGVTERKSVPPGPGCAACGEALFRRPSECARDFRRRRTCGRECAAALREEEGKRRPGRVPKPQPTKECADCGTVFTRTRKTAPSWEKRTRCGDCLRRAAAGKRPRTRAQEAVFGQNTRRVA